MLYLDKGSSPIFGIIDIDLLVWKPIIHKVQVFTFTFFTLCFLFSYLGALLLLSLDLDYPCLRCWRLLVSLWSLTQIIGDSRARELCEL